MNGLLKLAKTLTVAAMLLLLLSVVPVSAQTVYKGQLRVSEEQFTIQGSLLRVQMRVSYEGDVLNSGETLNFTPVLKTSTQQQSLSSVVISGKARSRYEKRKARLGGQMQRLNVAVVRKDDRQGMKYFDYDTTVPYSTWMSDAALYIESEESGWTGHSHLYEDKLIDRLPIMGVQTASPVSPLSSALSLRNTPNPTQAATQAVAPQKWIAFVSPTDATPVSEKTVSGSLPLADSKKICQMRDRDFCTAIAREVKQQLDAAGGQVTRLTLLGFGAPTGNYRKNEQQSAARAQLLKEYLISQGLAGTVTVTWTAEDWQTIQQLTQADRTIPLRSAALDLMQNVGVASGREDQLRMIGGGETYHRLQQTVFPQVQRIEWEATVLHRPSSDGDATVNLLSLYQTASAYTRGSEEYNDIIDLAARLYPDNAVAAINAAGVALTRGDLDRAERYLSQWQTDTRAYQNLGVLHLLRGDTARAEVYLKMAEAQGVSEASAVLND